MKAIHIPNTLILMMSGIMVLAQGQALSAQALLPPFVRQPEMTVINPRTPLADLSNINGFSYLAKSGNKVFASFRADPGRLGILVCNGESLQIEQVYWLDADEQGVSADQWCGLISFGGAGAAALCYQTGPDSIDKPIRAHLVIYSPELPRDWSVKSFELPEKPTALAYLPEENCLAGITEPSNSFFVYNLATAEMQVRQTVFDFVPYAYPNGRCLYQPAGGGLYGSYKGRLFCYYPESSFFEYLGRLPCQYGHLAVTALNSMSDDGQGTIVGGTSGDGYLFTLDSQSRRINSWGKPTDGTEILKIVYAGPSGFWGLAGIPGSSCRLFHFQPEKGLLVDLGVPAGVLKGRKRSWVWYAYQIADMLVLDDGRILMAESLRQAKLLVFSPNRSDK